MGARRYGPRGLDSQFDAAMGAIDNHDKKAFEKISRRIKQQVRAAAKEATREVEESREYKSE
jgi:hypothetical protein